VLTRLPDVHADIVGTWAGNEHNAVVPSRGVHCAYDVENSHVAPHLPASNVNHSDAYSQQVNNSDCEQTKGTPNNSK
jgi:hypothetical protein